LRESQGTLKDSFKLNLKEGYNRSKDYPMKDNYGVHLRETPGSIRDNIDLSQKENSEVSFMESYNHKFSGASGAVPNLMKESFAVNRLEKNSLRDQDSK
jgi:hypothetical protein